MTQLRSVLFTVVALLVAGLESAAAADYPAPTKPTSP